MEGPLPSQPDTERGDGLMKDPNVGVVRQASAAPYQTMEDEDSPVDNNNNDDDMQSIVSSVLTADGIHDVVGFSCVCLVILIGDMSRGVMFPSMWPLVASLGGTKVTIGYSVAAFSLGRVMVNPIFGSWSHKIGYSKVLLISTSILFLGTLLYSQIRVIGTTHALILAQIILGIGSGTLGVTRAFCADVTARRNRTTYMAWITAVQYAGFTVTPAFGALFNRVFREEKLLFGIIPVNMYNAPAYFMAVVVFSTILVLRTFFQDRQRILIAKPKKVSSKRQTIDDYSNQAICCGKLTIYEACILGCMLLNVSSKGSISTFETLGIALAESYFDMLSSRAGIIVATCGFLGVCALLQMHHLEQRFNDVTIIVFGIFMMAMGIFCWTFVRDDAENNPTLLYVVSIFLIYSVGYPIGHTAVIGMFSKIVGRRPQGYLQGWFASAGSLARMFFPILSGYMAELSTVQFLFGVLTAILMTSIFFVLRARNTLNLLSS